MNYFDLKNSHTYNVSGPSKRRYCFIKGKPVGVTDAEDANKFRMHSDIFYECDENGVALIATPNNKDTKSFVKFRPDIEDLVKKIDDSNSKTEEIRKNSNVDELLKQANKDAIINKPIVKIKKEKKVKNALECELCGYIAKNSLDLKDHLDKHSDEE